MNKNSEHKHLKRPEVDLTDSLLRPLLKAKNSIEHYYEELEIYEESCERKLTEILGLLGITAKVKTDRYSLPYQRELVYNVTKDEMISNTYRFERVARQITRELLNERVYKLRFYLFINIITNEGLARIEYRFRYHQNLNEQ